MACSMRIAKPTMFEQEALPRQCDWAQQLRLLPAALLPGTGTGSCRSSSICLAVLHPRKLAVYALQAVGSSYLQHSKIYEHYLEHTAADMVTGPFGGIAGEQGIHGSSCSSLLQSSETCYVATVHHVQ